MNWTDLEPRAIAVRDGLGEIMERMLDCRRQWDLAEPEPSVPRALETLRRPEYNVVVCGEVKRGKTTFVNGLLGESLLPTDVHVSTCQVFRISHAQTESFALVFDDGQRQPIGREDLVKYGSQREEDLRGESLLGGRQLQWIEVNVPAAFLPAGVHLLDTPGLGTLYAGHAEITQRWVAQADAVIFVLDSGQPLLKPEEEFLRGAYAVTPNILFVQTKIDVKEESAWQTTLRRHEELLNRAFPQDGKPPLRVYPVASPLLLEASAEPDATERGYLLDDSRFEQARQGMQAMLYRAVGWTRSAWAASVSAKYHGTVLGFFTEQQKVLAASSADEQKRLQAGKKALQTAFNQAWGAQGGKRLEIRRQIETITSAVKQEAMQMFGGAGTPIHDDFEKEIKALEPAKFDAYLQELSGRVAAQIGARWREIALVAQQRLSDSLVTFQSDLEAAAAPAEGDRDGNRPRAQLEPFRLLDGLKAARMDSMLAPWLAGGLVWVGLVSNPVGWAIAIGGGLWGLVAGWRNAAQKATERNRQLLCNHMRECIQRARHQMLDVDMKAGRPMSPVEEYIKGLKEACLQGIDQACEREKARLAAEMQRLSEQAALRGEERDRALSTVVQRLGHWREIGLRLQDQVEQLRQMQQELAAPAVATTRSPVPCLG